ncbi:MAG: hypothetical protein AABY49_07840 [Planctomycetota bacterium]
MKITRNENPKEIKQYDHIKPAPTFSHQCQRRLRGSMFMCTQPLGHSGPHIAHAGLFKKVVAAVWDNST